MRPIRRIEFTTHFLRALHSLPNDLIDEVSERERLFQNDCFDARLRTHKLKGQLQDVWSFSITYKHRVIFRFLSTDSVEFLDVDDHSVYH